MRSRWLEALVLATGLLTAARAFAGHDELYTLTPDGTPRPAPLSLVHDVKDPVFALLASLVEGEVYGQLSVGTLDSVVQATDGSSLPYQQIRWLRRMPAPRGWHATIEVEFAGRFEADVPYSILGYHPGSMKADAELVLFEWDLGRQTFWLRSDDDETTRRPYVADAVRLFGVREGRVDLDVAWFLDRMLRGALDDVTVTGFAFVRMGGKPYGLAFGYNAKGKGRTGVFDFQTDEVVFPAPKHFLSMGRILRGRMETLFSRLDPASVEPRSP
jgi:hypothetical protein